MQMYTDVYPSGCCASAATVPCWLGQSKGKRCSSSAASTCAIQGYGWIAMEFRARAVTRRQHRSFQSARWNFETVFCNRKETNRSCMRVSVCAVCARVRNCLLPAYVSFDQASMCASMQTAEQSRAYKCA